MNKQWLLTQAEGEKAVTDNFDYISLNRGHWEEIVPAIAQAQLKKVAEYLKTRCVVRVTEQTNINLRLDQWQALLTEAGWPGKDE